VTASLTVAGAIVEPASSSEWYYHFYSGAPLGKCQVASKIIMVEIFQYPFLSGVMIVKFKNLICTYDPLEARMARVLLYDYFL
jgi:hypothetical protein